MGAAPPPPPGLKYYTSAVEELLENSMYLDNRLTNDRTRTNVALPFPGSSDADEISGVQLFGEARPLTIHGTADSKGVHGVEKLGSGRAGVDIRWALSPDDDRALPNVPPLPTRLDTDRSQRFTMMEFEFRLDDSGEHCFTGFGTGRTYPSSGRSKKLSLGACGKILHGKGVFANAQGTFVMNGFISPPGELDCDLLIRILHPEEGQVQRKNVAAPRPVAKKGAGKGGAAKRAKGSRYITFIGAPNPDKPIQQIPGPGGEGVVGAKVSEDLRPVRLDYKFAGGSLSSSTETEDWVSGRIETTISFDPFGGPPGDAESPMPWGTEGTVITFFDVNGKEVGSLSADIKEGRGFQARYWGYPAPVLNLVGFGAFEGGTGALEGAKGMLSTNAAVAVIPPMLSNMYVLRLDD